jgi:hypothetical protein
MASNLARGPNQGGVAPGRIGLTAAQTIVCPLESPCHSMSICRRPLGLPPPTHQNRMHSGSPGGGQRTRIAPILTSETTSDERGRTSA